METTSRIFVAGHRGLAGSAIVRKLQKLGYANLALRARDELDLADRGGTRAFFDQERPDYVFLAAAKVGGLLANRDFPAEFIAQNLDIQNNVLESSLRTGVKRLLFLGSSCIYPRLAPQPIKEEYLLTGPLEFTNRSYAIAKIAGIEMCWAFNRQYAAKFLAVMPTNLYGPGDNYDLRTSHVLPALIRKTYEAMERGEKNLLVWGTGTPRREFLFSDDMAEACVHLMNLSDAQFEGLIAVPESPPLINVGSGEDLTIRELASTVCSALGYEGNLIFDSTKPDGTPRKLLDSTRLFDLGWKPRISLREGIQIASEDYREQLREANCGFEVVRRKHGDRNPDRS
jgi:GDP-L-fucose synthase